MKVNSSLSVVANRIIIVGDYERCNAVGKILVNSKKIMSKRRFLTITGLHKGVPVSVVCGGMGVSITDFIIREARQVIEGPMAMIRFGSCGVLHEDLNVGDMIVPSTSIMVQQNFFDDSGPFLLSKPTAGDETILKLMAEELKSTSHGIFPVATGGMVASTDSFYASQGKIYNDY